VFGLSESSYGLFLQALNRFPEIEQVKIFGSRAMGNYKPGSDVDVVLYGDQVDGNLASELSIVLNEQMPIPYHFDVLSFSDITSPELIDHINSFGQVVMFGR